MCTCVRVGARREQTKFSYNVFICAGTWRQREGSSQLYVGVSVLGPGERGRHSFTGTCVCVGAEREKWKHSAVRVSALCPRKRKG